MMNLETEWIFSLMKLVTNTWQLTDVACILWGALSIKHTFKAANSAIKAVHFFFTWNWDFRGGGIEIAGFYFRTDRHTGHISLKTGTEATLSFLELIFPEYPVFGEWQARGHTYLLGLTGIQATTLYLALYGTKTTCLALTGTEATFLSCDKGSRCHLS